MLISALVTPWSADGDAPDLDRFARLTGFALDHGCDQVLVAGSAGEGGALGDGEREALLQEAVGAARPHQLMAGLGHGRLAELVARGRQALALGVHDLLVPDPPGVGADSLGLRERWHGAIARALPDARLWPLAAPSLSGCELLPDDLARLRDDCANVVGVIDATGRLARLSRVRALCGDDFAIVCADDVMLKDALVDPAIRADGGCVVAANLAPGAVRRLHDEARAGKPARARELQDALAPLFGLGTVSVEETLLLRGEALAVPQRSRPPVPVKAALALLGIGSAACRPPLAPLGPNGLARVQATLRASHLRHPEFLAPLADYFEVDLACCLSDRAPRLAAAASAG